MHFRHTDPLQGRSRSDPAPLSFLTDEGLSLQMADGMPLLRPRVPLPLSHEEGGSQAKQGRSPRQDGGPLNL